MIDQEPLTKRLMQAANPSMVNKLRRLAWTIVQTTLFRWSPVAMHSFRRRLLRLFGAQIAEMAYVYPTTIIWAPWNLEMAGGSCLGPGVICYSVGQIRLKENALVSQGTHLCAATHDHHDPTFPLLVGKIEILEHAWVAAEAFIGPGVCIGAQAVVGARSVVVRDVLAGDVVAGNPARVVSKRMLNRS